MPENAGKCRKMPKKAGKSRKISVAGKLCVCVGGLEKTF
jgi:hypothetical protein